MPSRVVGPLDDPMFEHPAAQPAMQRDNTGTATTRNTFATDFLIRTLRVGSYTLSAPAESSADSRKVNRPSGPAGAVWAACEARRAEGARRPLRTTLPFSDAADLTVRPRTSRRPFCVGALGLGLCPSLTKKVHRVDPRLGTDPRVGLLARSHRREGSLILWVEPHASSGRGRPSA